MKLRKKRPNSLSISRVRPSAIAYIAVCAELAHEPSLAFAAYEDYLRAGDSDAERRTGAEKRLAAFLPGLAIASVTSDPPGATISIDGRPSVNTPKTFHDVKPGEHRIVLTRGSARVTQVAKVESGATMSVVASLQRAGAGSGWVAISAPVEFDVFERG